MTDRMGDAQFDRQIRNFLAWQAEDVADAPTAREMAARISSRVQPRAISLGLFPRLAWVVLAGLLLLALLGVLVVGGILRLQTRPAVVPPTAVATPVASALLTPAPSPSPSPSPQPSPPSGDSGTDATSIGQVSWTRLEGDATTIPNGDIFGTPNGFAAFESGADGQSKLWVSIDGLTWALTAMPVPATGEVGHSVSAGEHWIWSMRGPRVWRSTDFATWTEVDLTELKPPVVPNVVWLSWSVARPTTVGTNTVFPWYSWGMLALDELLGIELEPDETLSLRHSRERPALGDVRDVMRSRRAGGGDPGEGVKVGSIRVGFAGSVVTITDVERDVIVADIDANILELPAAAVAGYVNESASVGTLRGGALISAGNVRPLAYPLAPVLPAADRVRRDGFAEVLAVGDRFVGLTVDPQGPDAARLVWTSADGGAWESLGPPDLPVTADASVYFDQILRGANGEPGTPLVAPVIIDEAGGQRREIWTSSDGFAWVRLGPAPWSNLSYAPPGGYLAMGDDYRVHVSATGTEWTTVDGLTGVGAAVSENGGSLSHAVARDVAFIVEVPIDGKRLLWVLRVDANGV